LTMPPGFTCAHDSFIAAGGIASEVLARIEAGEVGRFHIMWEKQGVALKPSV